MLKSLDELSAKHIITTSVAVEDVDRAIDKQIEVAAAAYRAKANS